MKKRSSTGDTMLVTDADFKSAAHKQDSGNIISADNPRLTRYQQLVQQHLEKLNDQLGAQIRDLQISLKDNRLSNQENIRRIEKMRSEGQKEAEKTASMNAEIETAHKTRIILENEIIISRKSIEEVQAQIRSADKKEREVRTRLSNVNCHVGAAFGINKPGTNGKTNVKILKGISSRINQQLSSLEKEKLIQDAYVTRLKRDVVASEKELVLLEKTFDELKKEGIQKKSDYAELTEKLKAFEEGNLSVDDRWQKLMQSLQSKKNRIKLDQSQTLEEKAAELSLTVGSHISDKEIKKEAKELLKLEAILAARQKMKQTKEQELKQFEKALNETKNDIMKAKEEIAQLEENIIRAELKTANVKQQYAALRNSKGFEASDDDDNAHLERIEENIEKLRMQTALNRSKARKLGELVCNRNQNIADVKKDIVELSRRRIATTHKIERLETEASLLNGNIAEEKKILNSFNEMLRKAEIRKESFDKEPLPLSEVAADDEEEKQIKELLAKLEREDAKVTLLKDENDFTERNLQACRDELESWKKKLKPIDNDEAYAFDEERRNAIMVEMRRLKNLNSDLDRRIRETQKQLEMCALRRDFVVGKAQTTISRRNHVRSQALDEIERLKNRNAELRKEIDETNAECVRLQTSSITNWINACAKNMLHTPPIHR